VSAGQTSDSYVRATMFFASVLFLVGISSQFRSRGARCVLIALSAAVFLVTLVQLARAASTALLTRVFTPTSRVVSQPGRGLVRHHRTLTKAMPLWPLRSWTVIRGPDPCSEEPIRGPDSRSPS
jgi:hypothetical protein